MNEVTIFYAGHADPTWYFEHTNCFIIPIDGDTQALGGCWRLHQISVSLKTFTEAGIDTSSKDRREIIASATPLNLKVKQTISSEGWREYYSLELADESYIKAWIEHARNRINDVEATRLANSNCGYNGPSTAARTKVKVREEPAYVSGLNKPTAHNPVLSPELAAKLLSTTTAS